MDVRMPRMDGLAATRALRAVEGGPAVIVLTTFDEDRYVFGALQVGAAGFLLKTASAQRVAEALRAVAGGGGLIAPEVTRRLIGRFAAVAPARPDDPALDALTPRERDVLEGIARGLTNAQIATELVLEESTVKSHVTRLLAKLGLSSRVQAVIFAYETGLALPGRAATPSP
jgi:DNA-binding NarL/FixJ family response regulator